MQMKGIAVQIQLTHLLITDSEVQTPIPWKEVFLLLDQIPPWYFSFETTVSCEQCMLLGYPQGPQKVSAWWNSVLLLQLTSLLFFSHLNTNSIFN